MPRGEDAAVFVEGLDEARVAIKRFVDKVSRSAETEGDIRIEVWQNGAGAEDAIEVFDLDLEEPEETVSAILEAASQDAIELGRSTARYKLKTPPLAVRGNFTLRLPSEEDEFEDDIDELPTSKGIVTQLMRHNEKILKLTVQNMRETKDTLRGMLREQGEYVRTLEGNKLEQVKTYEELLDKKHVRDLEIRRELKKEKRWDEVGEFVKMGMPLLMAKFGGPALAAGMKKPAAPQVPASPKPETGALSEGEKSPDKAAPSPEDKGGEGASMRFTPTTRVELLAAALGNSFDKEQFQALFQGSLLRNDQKAALAELLQLVHNDASGNASSDS